jgi:putative transposase
LATLAKNLKQQFMPIPQKYLADFTENNIYHIYNRTNNKEKLFLNDDNRNFFLKQYAKYISPVAETFCWSLLPNHFHFLIRIKPHKEIVKLLQARVANLWKVGNPNEPNALSKTEDRFLNNEIMLGELVEFYFKSLFQSYSLAFNKVNNRKGNLFYKPFKRTEVIKESHFTQTIIYIHANAQRHNVCKDFTVYQWSSWHSLLSQMPTLLNRNEVLDWFGGANEFIKIHKSMTEYYYNCDAAIEDE